MAGLDARRCWQRYQRRCGSPPPLRQRAWPLKMSTAGRPVSNWGVSAVIINWQQRLPSAFACFCTTGCSNFLSRWLVRLEEQRRRPRPVRDLRRASGPRRRNMDFRHGVCASADFAGIRYGAQESVRVSWTMFISAMTFATVGMSDAYLSGPIRFVCGNKAHTGLVLIHMVRVVHVP